MSVTDACHIFMFLGKLHEDLWAGAVISLCRPYGHVKMSKGSTEIQDMSYLYLCIDLKSAR